MDGIVTTVLLLVVAFGLGIGVQRWLLRKEANAILEEARQAAARHRAQAEEEAQLHRNKITESRAALDTERKAFKLEQEDTRRNLRRRRQRVEVRERKNHSRTQKLKRRSTALFKATAALEALQKEAAQVNRVAELLRANADTLLQEATTQRSTLADQEADLASRREAVEASQTALQAQIEQQIRRLEEIGGLTAETAREALKAELIDVAKLRASAHIKRIEAEARRTARQAAQKVVLTAIQRTAASESVERTVSVVHLESDEYKGRIIGREGRNIRAFEAASGTEVIVDDTPGAVVLSCFDPVRREIARRAMQSLVQDGRIHPTNIEKFVNASAKTMEEELMEVGERALIDLNIHGIHSELIRLVGRMKFRSSYGQNLLAHSVETARIASLIAVEVGLDPALARRAGLLHDIGKVVTDASDQPHALVGAKLCKRYREDPAVCNAVGAHHDEIEMTALISPIVQAADAISGARPGARRATLEEYIRRLEQLEDLAASFEGVERVFAFQAGREIRVMVDQNRVADARAQELARDISQRIEDEMRYPGQIKVTVIRELRATAVAR